MFQAELRKILEAHMQGDSKPLLQQFAEVYGLDARWIERATEALNMWFHDSMVPAHEYARRWSAEVQMLWMPGDPWNTGVVTLLENNGGSGPLGLN